MIKSFFSALLCTALYSVSPAQTATVPAPAMPGPAQKALPVKITGDGTGFTQGVKIKSAVITVDTSIKVAPRFAYLSIDMSSITGSSLPEMLGGSTQFWVSDRTGKPVKIAEKFLKKIKGSGESNDVDFIAKIPFRLKTDNTPYIVRFRWTGPDKKKMIDFAVAVK